MQRRDALKTLGAGTLAAMGTHATVAGSSRGLWKTALGLNGFASSARKYGHTFEIEDVLKFTFEQRFDGIELHAKWPFGPYPKSDDRDAIAKLRDVYCRDGLQVFSIQTSGGGAFSADAQARTRWLAEFRDQAKFAKAMGCRCIGLWPGGPLRGQTLDEAIDHLGRSFHEAGQIAEDLGLMAAFEIEPVFIFNTEDHLVRILDRADHPSLKTIYDPSHFDLMNHSTGRPHELLERIGVDRIGYLHFTDTDGTLRDGKTSKHLPVGDGHIDVDASLRTLVKGGFRGWANVDAWEIPDPYDACAKAKEAFDRAGDFLP